MKRRILGAKSITPLARAGELKCGARCDLVMAGRLVCDPEYISDLIVRRHVPIIEACDGLEGKRNFYQILYNRITREYGKRQSFMIAAARTSSRKKSSEFGYNADQCRRGQRVQTGVAR